MIGVIKCGECDGCKNEAWVLAEVAKLWDWCQQKIDHENSGQIRIDPRRVDALVRETQEWVGRLTATFARHLYGCSRVRVVDFDPLNVKFPPGEVPQLEHPTALEIVAEERAEERDFDDLPASYLNDPEEPFQFDDWRGPWPITNIRSLN